MAATVTAIDTTVELPAPTNLLNPPRFSPVVVTPEMFTLPPAVTVLLKNKSCHWFVGEPKSLASSVEGRRSLSNLPVAVIVSLVALPKSTLPPNEVTPATAKLLPRTAAPLMVVIPAIETPPCS